MSSLINNPNHAYVNLFLKSRRSQNQGNEPSVAITSTNVNRLLETPSDYEMSVIRFTLNSPQTLPIWIPVIERKQTNANLTVYHLGLRYRTALDTAPYTVTEVKVSIQVLFQPQETGVPTPSAPVVDQDLNNRYYWVHTWDHITRIFNDSLQELNEDARIAIETEGKTGTLADFPQPPFINYNKQAEVFELYLDNEAYGKQPSSFPPDGSSGDRVYFAELYFDSNTQGLFEGFPMLKEGNDVSNFRGEPWFMYQIRPELPLGVPADFRPTYTSTANSATYLIIPQTISSLSSQWSPFQSIVFASNLIPAYEESNPEPLIFENGDNNPRTNSITNSVRVIADLNLPIFSADQFKQKIFFEPNVYRYTAMTEFYDALRQLDFKLFMRMRLNEQLVPLSLFNHGEVSIKLMFRKIRKTIVRVP